MITVTEWVTNGYEWITACVEEEGLLPDSDAHDGVHWYLELGASQLEEEYVAAWSYGLCGGDYPLHPTWVAMGREDRTLLPLELVNWLISTL